MVREEALLVLSLECGAPQPERSRQDTAAGRQVLGVYLRDCQDEGGSRWAKALACDEDGLP